MGDLFVQGINDTTLYAEKIYSQNFTQPNKNFVLSFIIMIIIVIYLLMVNKN